jgi:hypothetical protein
MTALYILLGVILLPFVVIMFLAIVGAVYMSWIFLLALCGFNWAQDARREIE